MVIGGISTGVTLALGPVAEEMEVPWLSWDGTTQKGVEETMPNPKWAFRSVDNEVEAIVAGQLTPKYFKGIKTVAGIGNDYSYGHDCWETYQAVLKRYIPDVKFVLELCALALPNGFTEKGLPLSLQIVCRGYEEATALRIGQAYQQATDWHRRLPPNG